VEPGPGGGGEQPHLGVGQDPVTAERAAEQAGRHDGHALGVQAAAMDVGAMHAQQPDRPGAKDAADDLSFPADRLQRPVQPVVVVPCQPVGALSRRRNQPALRAATCSAAAWWLVGRTPRPAPIGSIGDRTSTVRPPGLAAGLELRGVIDQSAAGFNSDGTRRRRRRRVR
jgi:hypothetical protein